MSQTTPQQSQFVPTILNAGISQPSGLQPKKVINIFGQEYVLCKDASDSTTSFPHNRVKIQNGDCIHVKDNSLDVYFCYIHGIIYPLPNSLEKPVDVYYVGFHKKYVDMRFITPQDVARMHIYKSDSSNWGLSFARNMLGFESDDVDTRDPISPFPEEMMIINKDSKVSKPSIDSGDNTDIAK